MPVVVRGSGEFCVGGIGNAVGAEEDHGGALGRRQRYADGARYGQRTGRGQRVLGDASDSGRHGRDIRYRQRVRPRSAYTNVRVGKPEQEVEILASSWNRWNQNPLLSMTKHKRMHC